MQVQLPKALTRPIVAGCLVSLLAFSPKASAQMTEAERVELPGQVVVCFESGKAAVDLESKIASWRLTAADRSLRFDSASSLMRWQRRGESVHTNVIVLEYSAAGVDELALRQQISAQPGVRWAAPNVGYVGDVKELVPNDTQYTSQYHHPLMQNDLAWDITLGNPNIVVGVTDDGVDTGHEDLAANIFINVGETPGDGIDNDGNGFIDDVNGFDFVSDNADPNPNNPGDDHGTHVAGIIGAKTDNGIGVAGTAGDTTLLPLQFFINGQPWTAVDIAEAFAYGTDNGAQIISTSYNINGWVGNPVVTAAFDYMYDNGVLHFNSAGNGNELNPARQAFEQTLLVVSTDSADERSGFSNYGTGCDVSAPGSSVLSTVLNDNYDFKSGTSMSTPNAAGVAALIWGENPTWTRDQVAAQLLFTAENIDALNPGFEGLLGSGRVNPFLALTTTLPAPLVLAAEGLPAEGGLVVSGVSTFALRFDQIMDPAAINGAGAFLMSYAGADDIFGTTDDSLVDISWDEYLIGGNEVRFTVNGAFAAGLYRFVAPGSMLSNPFGTQLDGDLDGVPGGSWTRTFEACSSNAVLVDNAESGSGWSVVNENVTDGAWSESPTVPIGGGTRSDPANDFDGSGRCFLTDNEAGNSDVDGGPTRLISRAFDLGGFSDPFLSYARWINSSGNQPLTVHVSNDDGATWMLAATHPSEGAWVVETLRVSDFVAPTATVRLRFSVEDAGTITEAGIDFLRILSIDCGDPGSVGTSYCQAAPNSTGSPSSISGQGSAVVADNNFTLTTTGLPSSSFSLYFFGPDQVFTPAQNGFICVGGSLLRILPGVQATPMGVATSAIDLTVPIVAANVIPGVNLNFQLWHRDIGGTGSNFSDALNVTWQ